MANIMTASDNEAKAGAWKMSFRRNIILNLLNYIKTVIDQVYTDIAASGSVELSFSIADADAASDTAVHAAVTLTGEAQTVTTGITSPDVPRAVHAKPTMAGASLTGNVVITGTDINNAAITDTLALNNGDTITSLKAFKTVTSIQLPAYTTEGDAISIGISTKLGSPVLLTEATIYLALVDGARDSALPTIVTDPADVAKVLVTPATAPNGARDFKFFYHI
jgi:hypothetical protein